MPAEPGRGGLLAVAALASAFGAALLQITGVLDTAMRADPTTGRSSTVRLLLALAAAVFIAIALAGSPTKRGSWAPSVVARAP
ncbi:MAG TPA: hypothetical protein VF053_14565 [Streptosporangiales bacterium]